MSNAVAVISPTVHNDALEFVRAYIRLSYNSLVVDNGDTAKLMDTLPVLVREAARKSTFVDTVLMPELEAEKRTRVLLRKRESEEVLSRYRNRFDSETAEISGSSLAASTKKRKLMMLNNRLEANMATLGADIERCAALLAKERIVIKNDETKK